MVKSKQLDAAEKRRGAKKIWLNRLLENVRKDPRNPELIAELREKIKDYEHLCEEVEFHMDELEMEADVKEQGEFLDEAKALLVTDHVLDADRGSVSVTPRNSQVVVADSKGKVRSVLPKLTLGTFSGDVAMWAEFRDTFQALVIDSEASNVLMMRYLKESLKGDAARVISGIPGAGDYFQEAWNALKERYDANDGEEKDRLLLKFQKIQPCKGNSAEEFQRIVDEVSSLMRQLRVLKVDDAEIDGGPRLKVMELVPPAVVKNWKSHARDKEVEYRSLSGFTDFLAQEAKDMRDSRSGVKQDSNQRNFRRDREPTGFALRGSRGNVCCTFCPGNHLPYQCKEPMSVDKRMDILAGKRGCFRCGMTDHFSKNCKWDNSCDCGGKHIRLLCRKSAQALRSSFRGASAIVSDSTAGYSSNGNSNVPSSSMASWSAAANYNPPQRSLNLSAGDAARHSEVHRSHAKVGVSGVAFLMRTVAMRVGNSLVRGLLDTGCSDTLVSQKVLGSYPLNVLYYKSTKIDTCNGPIEGFFPVIQLYCTDKGGCCAFNFRAIVVPDLGGEIERVDPEIYEEALSKIGEHCCADVVGTESDPLGVLFGEDLYDCILTSLPIAKTLSGISLSHTIFGLVYHGKKEGKFGEVGQASKALAYRASSKDSGFDKFWSLEHLGVFDALKTLKMDKILATVEKRGNRYFVDWPWIGEERPGIHRDLALARLSRLESKLSAVEKEQYSSVLFDLVEGGYLEEVQHFLLEACSYLPHHPVYRKAADDEEKMKTRPVWDASAKEKGSLSLNDCVDPGPSLLPKIFDILLRFRVGKFAVIGDLKKAFLQIRLFEGSREYTRFIWEGKEYRSTSVLFGVACSPAILQTVLSVHLQNLIDSSEKEEEIVLLKMLKENLYVDDAPVSFNTEEEAFLFWDLATKAFESASFTLHSAQSNVPGFEIPEEKVVKVLGRRWDVSSDCFLAELPPRVQIQSKRDLSSFLGKVYDPEGFLSPFLSPLRVVLQDLWIKNCEWDEPFDVQTQASVARAVDYLFQGEGLSLPRFLGFGCSELHVFCDSSKRLYSAVVYHKSSQNDVHLLAAKTRLVPPKMQDQGFSPKFELLGCLLASKLAKSIAEAIHYSGEIFFWCDSKVCVYWIRGEPRKWEVFVKNRVKEIQSVKGTWQYVPTQENPSDIPTRCQGVNLDVWLKGPAWLMDYSMWPSTNFSEEPNEVKAFRATVQREEELIPGLITPRVSKWLVFLRAVARCLALRRAFSDLTLEELEVKARTVIFRESQLSVFAAEIRILEEGKTLKEESPTLNSLRPFLDDEGLLRVGGRLEFSSLSWVEKHPVLLPKTGATKLFVLSLHTNMSHAGAQVVIAELRRQGFWFMRVRRTVASILRECRVCRRFRAAPYDPPEAPLPRQRISFTGVFDVTGVDLFGPMSTSEGKVWGAIFTCFQTRAVHLELAVDLSKEAAYRALQRFVSRRGFPSEIWSDHGTNFVALSKEFKGIWKFTVEAGPWWAGIWERLIRSVKGLLKRILKRKVVSREELETLLVNVESVVNKRPISYVWETPQEEGLPVVITPEHFLLFRGVDGDSLSEFVRKGDVVREEILDLWKKIYLTEVLGSLGQRSGRGEEAKVGDIVLIATSTNRMVWPLGKITEVFRGRDQVVRAATVWVPWLSTRGKSRVSVEDIVGNNWREVYRQGKGSYLTRPVKKLYRLEVPREDRD